jgi:hypothetical protein
MSEELKDHGKKTYNSPRLTVIGLRPEEAVLGACKNPSAHGTAAPSGCFSVINCSNIGS